MKGSNDKKFDYKYLELALMVCYFLIPFFGLHRASKNYLGGEDLPIWHILILLFIAGNIMTWMIFLMDGKSLKIKLAWTSVLLLVMVGVNFIVLI